MVGYLNCCIYTWGAGLGDTSWLQVSISIHRVASQINNDNRNSVCSLGCRYTRTLQLDVGEEWGYGSMEGVGHWESKLREEALSALVSSYSPAIYPLSLHGYPQGTSGLRDPPRVQIEWRKLTALWGSRKIGCAYIPTQGSNPGLQHCRQILYHLSHIFKINYMQYEHVCM